MDDPSPFFYFSLKILLEMKRKSKMKGGTVYCISVCCIAKQFALRQSHTTATKRSLVYLSSKDLINSDAADMLMSRYVKNRMELFC